MLSLPLRWWLPRATGLQRTLRDASLLLAITPGPGVLYIVTRSIAQGRRAGLASVAGVAVGNLARVKPSLVNGDPTAEEYHFGATLNLADLDGNGKADLMASAALNRAGAALTPANYLGNATQQAESL